ncbi:LysR family transcriptional regulator [Sphingorhabdus soli]|uniref:LysR family transcriptional regulator n=1 Tax=Flavisphingopyxis soli TaxID=2601267 RepID=A0A5C6UMA4_9SPHN|nr:LysR substrate-binding domain-containing protein [Sphingorhabdus soli]TXC74049.1 LysR family transcriptional regulator [Sphingorhabdus soli]
MRRLPPLIGLEAFAAVARLGSIKAAAGELSLSNPALSRRIQNLEALVGQQLFDRRHQALRLTEAGRRLQLELAPALDDLAAAIDRAVGEPRELRLRLNVLPLFASQRLFPRLPELRARHPELHLDVETGGHGELRLGDAVDAAIILTKSVDPDLYAVRLGSDLVFPIAARSLVEGGERITAPEQLQRMTVLIHSEMPETFDEWRRAIGMPYLEPAAIDHFDSGPLMLEAAAQGVGVAFMHSHHLDDARDDRLVRLFDFEVASPYAYYFACRPRALRTRPVKLFHDWLVEAGL